MYTWKNSSSDLVDSLRQEAVLEHDLAPGARGMPVRRVQEWLTLQGHALAIDGAYGAITSEVVAGFQVKSSLPATGKTDSVTYARLVAPLQEALRRREVQAASLNDAVLEYARAHLALNPREVGGQNRGPWVRMYMDGRDGAEWAWCAGFVTFVLRQACESLRIPMPIPGSVSCDSLAAQAKAKGLFMSREQARTQPVPAGSLFLVRRTDSDWTHVGIVERSETLLFHTIEGNSNDAGEREGYEVCSISRGYADKDFILLSPSASA